MLEIDFIPAFQDNYIWLLRNGQDAAVVDPGDATPVNWRLQAEALSLKAILVTHHHADHQGGVPALVETRGVSTVFGPANESITACNRPVSGGDVLSVLGVEFTVIDVPGHTAGHIAYSIPGAVFCGDTLFGAGCGRLFEGTPAQMAASLAKLAALPDDTLVYCAHEYTEANLRFAMAVEPDNADISERAARCAFERLRGRPTVPTTIGAEKRTNPFLRCHEPAVLAAARRQNPATTADPVSVFTTLREWKNNFR
ncbi:MAG: hydroxyacylglutathione hydrolase [Betaproteobacteria bacterium]